MRRILIIGVSLLSAFVFGKDKPIVTIQIISSQASVRESTTVVPATAGKSTTDCDTTGHVNDDRISANTNCTTKTAPGQPAQTLVNRTQEEHVRAIMPNGDHVVLWCQEGLRRCVSLEPGSYEAELKGDAAWVYTHDLAGKLRKTKYRAVGGWSVQ